MKQKDAILGELRAGRPIALEMSLRGLSSWGYNRPPGPTEEPDDTANHAFVVLGFQPKRGVVSFQTMNSWGGWNPDVSELELCRVYHLTMLYAPNETPPRD